MRKLLNPYTPGAGVPPKYLAGRDATIREAEDALFYIKNGDFSRSVVYYGLRGVGKTVLLNKIEEMADEEDIRYEHLEISERSSFKNNISLHILKLIQQLSAKAKTKGYLSKALSVLKAFSIKYSPEGEISLSIDSEIDSAVGISDTGNFENDLTELLVSLGTLAQKQGTGVALFIDEIQYMKDDEFEALIAAIHRVNQKALPLIIFAAGLPKIAKIAGDVKSYAERLFKFVSIGSLEQSAARLALEEPAKKWGVSYSEVALEKILQITECYPYFLQEYGNQVWAKVSVDKRIIDATMVDEVYSDFEKSLDESFFKVRHDRATSRELDFMIAMVKCGTLPCSTKAIAEQMQCPVSAISPLRAQLIHKGFIYSANRGEVDFTVPQFDKYLKRIHNV
ncbi:Cdc6-like AAA superfamily ATPase [Trichococcus patagoniensis]|uniref:Cdc6-like AAA superfamily ATPase n=1 Tax=Trichococcus patagoniensis TaxID=382641 RepID=A0A2T5IQ28_9LACT|nr:ATP-binding protein [Trichococcus patagoniensis]PTQ85927.1 Cdc6-like AAA superfamily ATPase [Trichococcus patagoniensis]